MTNIGLNIGSGGLCRTLPLRTLDRDFLERPRIGEAGDLAERGLAYPRADTVEKSEFPDRCIDRFLVDQRNCPKCCGNPQLLCRGTRSSNPSPSTGESAARSNSLLSRTVFMIASSLFLGPHPIGADIETGRATP